MTICPVHHRRVRGRHIHPRALVALSALLTAALLAVGLAASSPASAAAPGLGSAAAYSVLGGTTVTNTGSSVLSGDLGVSPGNAITGFSTATVGGATHAGDAAAAQAQSDLTAAYGVTAGLTPTGTSLGSALVGGVHDPGVYNAASALDMSGAVTLDAQGDPNAVFVFQIGSDFTTASSSSVVLTGAAQACNVFWQVGSSATLGTNSTFVGTIMALTSITVTTGTTVQGRALARNGAVTLDDNVFSAPGCATTTTTPPSSPASSPAGTPTSGSGATTTTTPATGSSPAQLGTAGVRDVAAAGRGSGTGAASSSTTLANTGVARLKGLLLLSALLVTLGLALLELGGHRFRDKRAPQHR